MAKPQLTYKGVVYPWHCDHVGHMNVMWYTGKFDEATWNFFEHIGLYPELLKETGMGMVALEQTQKYKSEVHAGQTIEIVSYPVEASAKTVRFTQEMRDPRSGKIFATQEALGLFFDLTARKGSEFPDSVSARLAELLNTA